MNMQNRNNYTPDVLDCLANLSNDEVFTPPTVVNQMLDMLPQEVFMSKDTTFLDPFTKSGVFLREITKRLLENQIPDYKKTSDEIEIITKEAIQNAVRSGSLDLDDKDYEDKARSIGDAALKSHPDANKYLNFEIDLQDALDHILKNQVFGIAITELTAQLARRSLYCSKDASSRYSVANVAFGANADGNIRFEPMKHTWDKANQDGTAQSGASCKYCGASASNLDRPDDLESHAYEFIHKDIADIRKEFNNMEFTVVCGNPPYQLNLGNEGGNSSKARAIYNKFIDAADKLKPKHIVMITPARWMNRSAEGISDEWIDNMLNRHDMKEMVDFEDSDACFPSLAQPIKGGVCYYHIENGYNGMCHYTFVSKDGERVSRNTYLPFGSTGVVIRDSNALDILNKVIAIDGDYYDNDEKNMSGLVSPKDFFTNKQVLTSAWTGYSEVKTSEYNIAYYMSNKGVRTINYVKKSQIPKNVDSIALNKVYMPAAGGSGMDSQILGQPILGEPNSVCSQTFLVIGYDAVKHNFTKAECENIISYIKTKFFRYLVSIKKKTQNGPRGVYQFVPVQDFSKSWTDAELYDKYNLTQEEIDFIESMVKSME